MPNEPSIAIDPFNVKNLVAGVNINYLYYSNDTGQTWTRKTMDARYVYGEIHV